MFWGLTCSASTRTQWAVITEQKCEESHGLGPSRVAVLWVRCGGTPSSSTTLSLWGREWVEQHLQTTTRSRSARCCFIHTNLKHVCVALPHPHRGSPTERSRQKWRGQNWMSENETETLRSKLFTLHCIRIELVARSKLSFFFLTNF